MPFGWLGLIGKCRSIFVGFVLISDPSVWQMESSPGFFNMKLTRSISTPPGWDACPFQGYSQHKFACTHLYTWVKRGTLKVKCLAQEHNITDPRTGLETDRPLDLEASAQILMLPRLHPSKTNNAVNISDLFWSQLLLLRWLGAYHKGTELNHFVM